VNIVSPVFWRLLLAPTPSDAALRHRRATRAQNVLAAMLLSACLPSTAQIYVSASDDQSSIVLSNFQSTAAPVLLIGSPNASIGKASAPTSTANAGSVPAMQRIPAAPADVMQLVADVATQVQIAPELLHAVIAAESRYNPRAVSARGAIGLMQLMPATATRFGARDPFVARQNVLAGASYLKWLMVQFENDLELVLAAYNAGEQAVVRAGGKIPPYPETQAYVPRVLAYMRCAASVACKPA
jgi:soluble lytic murein transglycosylase-like protein